MRAAARARGTYIVGENEPQDTRLVRSPEQGGYGMDSLWNDDFHHSAIVALTGRNEAYYTDYHGAPQEFISAAKWGYLSRASATSGRRRAAARPRLDLPPCEFRDLHRKPRSSREFALGPAHAHAGQRRQASAR